MWKSGVQSARIIAARGLSLSITEQSSKTSNLVSSFSSTLTASTYNSARSIERGLHSTTLTSFGILRKEQSLAIEKQQPISIRSRWLSEGATDVNENEEGEKKEELPEYRTIPNEKVDKIAEEIVSLSLMEVAELTKILKDRLGIDDSQMFSPYAGQPMMGGPGGAEESAPEEEEKTSFDVKLEKFESGSKLKVIKEVRAITGLGLKEAKELVEKAPCEIKAGITKEEAESIKEKLSEVGAEINIE